MGRMGRRSVGVAYDQTRGGLVVGYKGEGLSFGSTELGTLVEKRMGTPDHN